MVFDERWKIRPEAAPRQRTRPAAMACANGGLLEKIALENRSRYDAVAANAAVEGRQPPVSPATSIAAPAVLET
jgi:hypothetical protein